MFAILATVSLLAALVNASPPFGSTSVTTESIVLGHGYPYEEHQVQTADGYLLTMHRIPYSARVPSTGPRPVAFVMHGLFCSSSDWVLNGPDAALAYVLSDAGYDVWMGNARGNTYSRDHVNPLLNPIFPNFWAFSWHEIAIYDLPAMIDYTLHYTGAKDLHYIGHSQGTTTILILNAVNPDFGAKLKSTHLLAPVAYMGDLQSPLVVLSAPFLGYPNGLLEGVSAEFFPNSVMLELLGYAACMDQSPVQEVCANVMFLMGGYDTDNMNATLIPTITETTPAGSSYNQIIHYLQLHNSKTFRPFDYGWLSNLRKYSLFYPQSYPLHQIKAPLNLYYSGNDLMSAVSDVERLMADLPTAALRDAYLVPHPKWNHLDYMFGLNGKKYVYNEILRNMATSL